MAVYGSMVITNQGLNLYAKIQAGTAVNFTRMQIGSGQLTGGQDPKTLTALITPISYFAINSITSSSNTAHVKGIFENTNITVSTYSCELGLFATDPDLGEILYAYATAGTQGDTISPISAGPFSKQFQIHAAIGNATSVTATIPAGAYAPLDSPTFTGVPAASTAAADTNTAQLATTSFVLGQAGTATPAMDGVAAVGTSKKFARQDHIHPTDTSRAPLASPTFTGTVTLPANPATNLGAAPKQYVDAHSSRTDNPHAVTAAQVGALSSAALPFQGGNQAVVKISALELDTDTRNKTLAYDATTGNLTTITEKDGTTTVRTTTLGYDTAGNLTTVTEVAGGNTVTTTLSYDTSGNLTGTTKTVV